MVLSILGWLACGICIGLIASRISNLRGDDPRISVGVSAAAAVLGGGVCAIAGASYVLSLLVAAICAVGSLAAWNWFRHRSPYDAPTFRRTY